MGFLDWLNKKAKSSEDLKNLNNFIDENYKKCRSYKRLIEAMRFDRIDEDAINILIMAKKQHKEESFPRLQNCKERRKKWALSRNQD